MASILGGQGSKRTVDGAPGLTGPKKRLSCLPEPQAHHSPILLCLPLSAVICPSTRLQTACSHICLSPQCRCPGVGRAGLGRGLDIQENCQWEEKTQTDAVRRLLTRLLLSEQPLRDWAGMGLSPKGAGTKVWSQTRCPGRAVHKQRPGF